MERLRPAFRIGRRRYGVRRPLFSQGLDMTEETLFAAALEMATPAERSAFLDDACAGDAALRRRVEALLLSHEQADFLRAPAVERPAAAIGATGAFTPETGPEVARVPLHERPG